MADENPAKPFYSVLVLAFVCSALVAGAAVGLRPMQEANKLLDRKKHILYAAGLYDDSKTIEEMFAPIKTRVVDLESGQFVEDGSIDGGGDFNQVKSALTKDLGRTIPGDEDIAKLHRIEKYSLVYLVMDGGQVKQVVLPVRGKGLWSTMYAYVSLAGDMSTIRGVSFYEHGETPGLGGEIENRRWQQGWVDKKIYDQSETVKLSFAKGKAAATGEAASYMIDGLSGATLTTKGVEKLMKFWFGDHGFKPFIENMSKKESTNG
ncbi:Na(+)-translocating NADH-quinone reductase subunit C [Desulforhopalus singaporensis]|uniref:Na(+)-translocating NADH-quinone reductase subunit C n=1 Tax=Desulforhopalus singaporensis TaxID=91360 RepID=A0A1H0SYG7_9BACT|nr:Na(+)-translocating NADH-quinone reductase subunit C [Desulforhopalus singaporensis]SDP46689.1 Na+-transporting NADH:ubiquinone oxidoreductase subunit C [Desulforhopalus singaporensis]